MSASEEGRLHAEILAAHASGDGAALARLYGAAAEDLLRRGETDAACFYWVQAMVFALEAGDGDAAKYQARLRAHGREV